MRSQPRRTTGRHAARRRHLPLLTAAATGTAALALAAATLLPSLTASQSAIGEPGGATPVSAISRLFAPPAHHTARHHRVHRPLAHPLRSAHPTVTRTAAAAAHPTHTTAAPRTSAPTPATTATHTPATTPTATSFPVTTGGASPSGVAMPVGDLPGWKQLFAQDFTTAAPLGTFTSAYPGWAGYDGSRDTSKGLGRPVSQQGVYDSATTSSVANGVYDCYLHTQSGTPQVCALTPAIGGRFWNGQQYGRYSVRFKIDDVPGYKIAWLLWPSSGRWSDGEIDFPEADLDSTATATAHQVGNPSHNEYWVNTGARLTGWHTATIEWVPGKVTFDLDGKTWQTTDPAVLPSSPMRWALQAETQLSAQAPAASAAGHIDIDWLTAYSYTG